MTPARTAAIICSLLGALALIALLLFRIDAPEPEPAQVAEATAVRTEPIGERGSPDIKVPVPARVRDHDRATTAGGSPGATTESRGRELEASDPDYSGDPARAVGLPEPAVDDAAESDAEGEEAVDAPTGVLDPASIQEGILERLGEIRECYEAWLGRNPNLEGKLVVDFTIGQDEEEEDLGVVTAIDIADSTVDHVWMEGCVASVMQDVEFPAPEGGEVQVSYPFYFSSE